MYKLLSLSIVNLALLVACGDNKKPSESHFKDAINAHLVKHGQTCVSLVDSLPIDVSDAQQRRNIGSGAKLAAMPAALQQVGLLHSSHVVAVMHDSYGLSSPQPQPLTRYELTNEGKKYFKQTPGLLGGQTSNFCYGQEKVDSVVKWTEPMTMGPYTMTQVTYTYKLENLADWAKRPDIQDALPNIKANVDGASKTEVNAELQLTNKGWEVPGR